jgi:hypothetical protein
MPSSVVCHSLFALALGAAALAHGAPSGPISCAGIPGLGGCPPYAELNFGTGLGSGSIFEYEETALAVSETGPFGTASGAVDLRAGTLRTYARGFGDGNGSTNNGVMASATLVDFFTLHRLGAPSPDFFTFSVVVNAAGLGAIDPAYYTVAAYLSLRVDGPVGVSGGRFDDARVIQSVSHVPQLQEFPLGLMVYADVSAPLETPFQLSLTLRNDASEASFLDFMHTAELSFVLPEGVTVTSMGGYASPVPELPPAALLLLGLPFLARRDNRRPCGFVSPRCTARATTSSCSTARAHPSS